MSESTLDSAAQEKDYILVILFVKYVSDVFQHHGDALREEFEDHSERFVVVAFNCPQLEDHTIDRANTLTTITVTMRQT